MYNETNFYVKILAIASTQAVIEKFNTTRIKYN